MESGIYRDLSTNEDFVVFGGRIACSIGWNESRKDVVLQFIEADKKYEIGEEVDKATFENQSLVNFVFDDVRSVDMLINDLLCVKGILSGMPIEELRKKHNQIKDLNEPTGKQNE